MKIKITLCVCLFALCGFAFSVEAQETIKEVKDLGNNIMYSFPRTNLYLNVEAEKEVYVVGPYVKYAEKYLGIKVPKSNMENYSLKSIKLTSYLDADPNSRAVLKLGENPSEDIKEMFLKFTSQGLIMFSDQNKDAGDYWRFPSLMNSYNFSSQAAGNFKEVETVLYKNDKNSSGDYDRVPIQQTQVVTRSLEDKAREASDMIFNLRQRRIEIITGDTDASFSGEALGKAVEVIDRLEAEYLSLFLGKYSTAIQSMSFEVIPEVKESQLYIAFRMSNKEGLMLPKQISGRPITVELLVEPQVNPIIKQDIENPDEQRSKKEVLVSTTLSYRVPANATVRVLDGSKVLLQTRMPIYQLGQTFSFTVLNKKYIN